VTAETKPFSFPEGYFRDPKNLLVDKSLRDYVRIFEAHKNERPGGKLAAADVAEIMRLAESLGVVHSTEIAYIRELIKTRPQYFLDAAQVELLTQFADTHEVRNQAMKEDFVEDIIDIAPIQLFRLPAGMDFIRKARALAAAVKANEAFNKSHGTYDVNLVQQVDTLAAELRTDVEGFTLSDVDKPGREPHETFWRDVHNLLMRTGGKTDHESKWKDNKWTNWNRDVVIYPQRYEQPQNFEALRSLFKLEGPLRLVGGGHAFNNAASMGGDQNRPVGTLVTLDNYRLENGKIWERVQDARAKYHVSEDQAKRVVRVSAGMRLRDFTKTMFGEGMALPVAGSTDAQSLAGLIATDLHSTGHTACFLSQQLLEVTVLNGNGERVSFIKDEAIDRGRPGRWTWTPPGATQPQKLSWLPVSGAIGTAGAVCEIVLKLDAKYHMRKREVFVPRDWAEANIERLIDPAETDPLFAYDHVSFYYAGGGRNPIKTIRMNAWKRTADPISKDMNELKTVREIFDLVGSGFAPKYLLDASGKQSPLPGQAPRPDDDRGLTTLNNRAALVFPAYAAFARKLFFQHDEIEVGIPMGLKADGKPNCDVFRAALADTLHLLREEEFATIIEVRFTSDVSEGMLGPGTNGPVCYLELATPFGDLSKARIVEVYHLFDRLMREKYGARPHLGKKTTAGYGDMAALYGDLWEEFQTVRHAMDPDNKFLPADNALLTAIFRKPGTTVRSAP
jgi:FAD/FMN-containing dehydrogenase